MNTSHPSVTAGLGAPPPPTPGPTGQLEPYLEGYNLFAIALAYTSTKLGSASATGTAIAAGVEGTSKSGNPPFNYGAQEYWWYPKILAQLGDSQNSFVSLSFSTATQGKFPADLGDPSKANNSAPPDVTWVQPSATPTASHWFVNTDPATLPEGISEAWIALNPTSVFWVLVANNTPPAATCPVTGGVAVTFTYAGSGVSPPSDVGGLWVPGEAVPSAAR